MVRTGFLFAFFAFLSSSSAQHHFSFDAGLNGQLFMGINDRSNKISPFLGVEYLYKRSFISVSYRKIHLEFKYRPTFKFDDDEREIIVEEFDAHANLLQINIGHGFLLKDEKSLLRFSFGAGIDPTANFRFIMLNNESEIEIYDWKTYYINYNIQFELVYPLTELISITLANGIDKNYWNAKHDNNKLRFKLETNLGEKRIFGDFNYSPSIGLKFNLK